MEITHRGHAEIARKNENYPLSGARPSPARFGHARMRKFAAQPQKKTLVPTPTDGPRAATSILKSLTFPSIFLRIFLAAATLLRYDKMCVVLPQLE
jgi:hypothetical protein